jgi:hypothetical protein
LHGRSGFAYVSPVKNAAALVLALASLSACGPATPAQGPEPAKEGSVEPAASASAAPAETAAPEAAKPPPAAESSPSDSLAHDLVKAGGRRIGWSASKKRFVVPVDLHADGGRGLDLRFYDDEGAQREILRVCQPGECEESLDEKAKELLPKLSARLGGEGYEPVSAVGWPSGRDEIEVGTLQAKLRQEKGRISLVREKKATPLRALGGRSPKGEITAVYPIPSAKMLGVLAGEFFVFKLP